MVYRTFTLSLNSANGQNGMGLYGGNITFPITGNSISGIVGFRVKQVTIENSIFNVLSQAQDGGRGWYLALDYVGNVSGATTVNILPGAYSILELLNQIATQLQTATGTTFTATYSNPTQTITIARTGGVDATFTLNPTSSSTNGWARLGFPTSTGSVASATGTTAYTLVMVQNARVLCQTLADPNSSASFPSGTQGQVNGIMRSQNIVSVPLCTVNSWSTAIMQIPTSEFLSVEVNAGSLSFRLTDDQGFDLLLTRSFWSIDLEIKYISS